MMTARDGIPHNTGAGWSAHGRRFSVPTFLAMLCQQSFNQ
jgi:hypothetical protein